MARLVLICVVFANLLALHECNQHANDSEPMPPDTKEPMSPYTIGKKNAVVSEPMPPDTKEPMTLYTIGEKNAVVSEPMPPDTKEPMSLYTIGEKNAVVSEPMPPDSVNVSRPIYSTGNQTAYDSEPMPPDSQEPMPPYTILAENVDVSEPMPPDSEPMPPDSEPMPAVTIQSENLIASSPIGITGFFGPSPTDSIDFVVASEPIKPSPNAISSNQCVKGACGGQACWCCNSSPKRGCWADQSSCLSLFPTYCY